MKYETFHEGVVAERDGRFYARTEMDGNAHRPVGTPDRDGFGAVEDAHIGDPRYCKSPTDMVRKGNAPAIAALSQSRLLKVTVRTIYEVSFPQGDAMSPDPLDTSALAEAIAADLSGSATDEQKSLLIHSTDTAGQRELCAKWGWPFPGKQ